MILQALLDKLNTVPIDRRQEEIQIYVRGELSGLLDIAGVDISDSQVLSIDTFDLRRRERGEK